MNSLTTKAFWVGAGERAAKTAAQTWISLFGADAVFDVLHVHWQAALGIGLGAALLSILTSIASAPASPAGSPSLVDDRPTAVTR